jgi:hypothetical protein
MPQPETHIPQSFPSGEVIPVEYRENNPILLLTKQFNIPFVALIDEAYDIAFNQAGEKGVTMYRTSGEVEIVSSKTGEIFTLHYMKDKHELYDITVEPI